MPQKKPQKIITEKSDKKSAKISARNNKETLKSAKKRSKKSSFARNSAKKSTLKSTFGSSDSICIYALFSKCRKPLVCGFRKKTPLSVRRCGGGGVKGKGGTENVCMYRPKMVKC